MRKRFEEFIVLPCRKPRYYGINPFTGSRKMCKYRVVSYAFIPDLTRPIDYQFRRLKKKRKYVVKAMNLDSVRKFGLWDI